MPFSTSGLSKREVQMVRKLIEAGQDLESVFWRQSDPEGLAIYQALANCPGATEKDIRHYLLINGNRYDLLEGNKPFLANTVYEPGHALYPPGITRKEIEDFVAAHPARKAEIYNPWTVVRRSGKDLIGIPYHVAFRQWLVPAAKALRDAASLSDDKAFATFLRLRADALLTDDYYKSDLAWVDLYVTSNEKELGTEGDASHWTWEDPQSKVQFTDDTGIKLQGKSSLLATIKPYSGGRCNLIYHAPIKERMSLEGKKVVIWEFASRELAVGREIELYVRCIDRGQMVAPFRQHPANLCRTAFALDPIHQVRDRIAALGPFRSLAFIAAVINQLHIETADRCSFAEHVGLQVAGGIPGRLSARRGIEREDEPSARARHDGRRSTNLFQGRIDCGALIGSQRRNGIVVVWHISSFLCGVCVTSMCRIRVSLRL
jgi:hypothetical protein